MRGRFDGESAGGTRRGGRQHKLQLRRERVQQQLRAGRALEDTIASVEAALDEPQLVTESLKLDAAIVQAQQQLDAAREQDRADVAAVFDAQIAVKFREMLATLERHVVANEELLALCLRRHEYTGTADVLYRGVAGRLSRARRAMDPE